MYSYEFNKPYTKTVAMSLGMFLGMFYLRYLEYRKCPENERSSKHPIIHYCKSSNLVTIGLWIYFAGMLMFSTSIPLTANQDAYSWTKTQNVMFFTFARLGYLSAIFAFLLAIFFGKTPVVHTLLSHKIWRPFSRLTFAAYLVYPISIAMTFYMTDVAVYINIMSVVYYFLSNLIIAYALGFVLFMLFEAPVENLIQLAKSNLFMLQTKPTAQRQTGKYENLKDVEEEDSNELSHQ